MGLKQAALTALVALVVVVGYNQYGGKAHPRRGA
jgi:hypothetical protein